MCGRFSLKANPNELTEAFPGFELPADFAPRYNIAPTQPVAVIANNGQNKIELFHWGLIPSWAQDTSIGSRMINARAETLAVKPAFRAAYKRRRCLVLADGFYEWQKQPGNKLKTPMYIQLKSGQPFGFAGLWELWQPAEAEPLLSCAAQALSCAAQVLSCAAQVLSCAIITTTPNALMKKIHDRMPVILQPQDYALWLDPAEQPADKLGKLLKPYPAAQMEAFAVSRLVNDPKNDSAECIAPAK